MKKNKIVAIIPARMASSRFPGKPLLKINGLEMVEHVRRRALLCKGFSEVVVATCDKKIMDIVKKNNGKSILTSKIHKDCNERIYEASKYIDCTHVVNVQGDEILILPKYLDLICKEIKKDPKNPYWNAISNIHDYKELINESIVKCFVSNSNNIIFCQRNIKKILYDNVKSPIKKLLGIQAFSKDALRIYSKNDPTYFENKLSIGQLRIIENNFVLKAINIAKGFKGIDLKKDIKIVQNYLRFDKEQKLTLKKIISL